MLTSLGPAPSYLAVSAHPFAWQVFDLRNADAKQVLKKEIEEVRLTPRAAHHLPLPPPVALCPGLEP